MRLAIVGSRSITDPSAVFPLIDMFIREQNVGGSPVILSGGATGVDSLVKKYAEVQGFDFIEFLPYHMIDKVEFSPRYFFSRNRQMVHNADKVLAIWDEKSTGTQHTIRYSQKVGVPVMVYKVRV